jgi:hypothetical protein
MSKLIGDRLPASVREAFDGTALKDRVGPAYLVVTPDPDGTPRPCMLSAGEVLAVDDRTLRFALWPGSRTSENLARGVPTLFCYVVPGEVLYLRGQSRSLEPAPGSKLERFEIAVTAIESDMHRGMPVTAGLRFEPAAMEPSELAEAWERQIEALRRD